MQPNANGQMLTANCSLQFKDFLCALGVLGGRTQGLHQIKKRPELFSSGRLGSPPPELPNHTMDTRATALACKRHFGNPRCAGGKRRNVTGVTGGFDYKNGRFPNEISGLLRLPGASTIRSGPDFARTGS